MIFTSIPRVTFASDDTEGHSIADATGINIDSIIDCEFAAEVEAVNALRNARSSQARSDYFALLDGNYSSGELRQRFVELFGWYSADDIRNNASEIFDMPANLVDAGIINILTFTTLPYPEIDLMRMEFPVPPDELFKEDLGAYVTFEPDPLFETMIYMPAMYLAVEDLTQSRAMFDDIPPVAEQMEIVYHPKPVADAPPEYMRYYADERELRYYADERELRYYADERELLMNQPGIEILSTADVNIALVSMTTTSVTLDLFYNPVHDSQFNRLSKHDLTIAPGGSWVPLFGEWNYGLPRIHSGRRTISGLVPGATYTFSATVWCWGVSRWINRTLEVTLPGQRTPSWNVSNITQTSFTVNVTFPVEGICGNILYSERNISCRRHMWQHS